MSGVEIVGVVLGAFPLLISAMEHYEETKKVSKGWWQIRRAHKKDLGNLKDCSLAFRTHLRELLLPLLLEETTDRSSYDDLLANPGGAGWQRENVDRALAERLSDHHERYLEILKEMAEAMAKLSSECKVEDKEFQAGLAGRQSQTQLSLNANVRFEAKRAAYALTAFKRDSLLAEVERYVHKLKEILAANDRVNAITGRSRNQTPGSGVPKAFLQLWQHAESIFKLVKKAWQCQCTGKSDMTLWLGHRIITKPDMRLLINFCHGPSCLHVKLFESSDRAQQNVGKKVRLMPPPRRDTDQDSESRDRADASRALNISAQTLAGSRQVSTSSNFLPTTPSDPNAITSQLGKTCNPMKEDLCKVTSHSLCEYGTLVDECNHREYHLAPELSAPMASSSETISLSDLLGARTNAVPRLKRLGLALIVASSHAQLHSSSWMKAKWTLEDVRVPKYWEGANLHEMYDYPCLHSTLDNETSSVRASQPDQSFKTLGIVLLELCFGFRLDKHPLWSDQDLPRNPVDPIQRLGVAQEWAQDVELEAGEDYATAVEWCLQRSPNFVRNEKWREEFVRNVVQPLQRCYESMAPRNIT